MESGGQNFMRCPKCGIYGITSTSLLPQEGFAVSRDIFGKITKIRCVACGNIVESEDIIKKREKKQQMDHFSRIYEDAVDATRDRVDSGEATDVEKNFVQNHDNMNNPFVMLGGFLSAGCGFIVFFWGLVVAGFLQGCFGAIVTFLVVCAVFAVIKVVFDGIFKK